MALTLGSFVLRGQQPATNSPATSLAGTNAAPAARGQGAAFDPFERATLPVDFVFSRGEIQHADPGDQPGHLSIGRGAD